MSFNGSGVFSIINTFVYDTVISETAVNANFSDIATGLSTCITKDGQTTVTANIPMASNRFTGLSDGSAAGDSTALHQIQDQDGIWCGTAGGTINALTITPSPAITAYSAGQVFTFKAGASPSDSAVTIAVSGLTTVAAELNGAAFSASVVIEADKYYSALYDGTALQLTRLSSPSGQADVITTRGDLIRGSSAGVAERLAIGTTGYTVLSDGTDAGWGQVDTTGIADDAVTLAKVAAGTSGELPTWDAAGDPATVAVGTAAQVLTSNGAGAAPTFQDAGGGAWEFVSVSNPSGAATVEFTAFAAGYDYCIAGWIYSSAGGILSLQVGTGATPTWQTSSYKGDVSGSGGGGAIHTTSGTAGIQLNPSGFSAMSTADDTAMSFEFTVYDVGETTITHPVIGLHAFTTGASTGGATNAATVWAKYDVVGAITALRFSPASGTLTGQCSLYRRKVTA